MGQPIDEKTLASRERLTSQGASHVLGIQGQLWGENLRDAERLEYMAFPRVIALAERAWARSPGWAQISDPTARDAELQRDWNQFANRLGQRELPRLDYLAGGVRYRLPPPGAVVRDGKIWANVAFPGLAIRYRIDSNDSNENSILYQSPISGSTSVKLQSFDTRGRGSRTIEVEGNKPGSTPVANTGLRL
jgi:hexosaminidase